MIENLPLEHPVIFIALCAIFGILIGYLWAKSLFKK